MITFLLWVCPFTWPFAIMRMLRKRREQENDRLIEALTGEAPRSHRKPLTRLAFWSYHKAAS